MERRTLEHGRYQLIEELGRGGMATVWRALDTRLGVERAVKVLKPHLDSASTNARARFEREARLMAGLEHPHITPVHDVGEDDGVVWIVMSLLGGGSLADHLKAFGALPPAQTCEVARGVLLALVAAHERSVVHRDIKPHNVLLDRQGTVRLADFGIARVVEAEGLTQTGAVMGTWAYMAPEQRLSANRADPRSDLYAVGALVTALTTGNEPFDLHNPQSHPTQLGMLPPPLRRFVVACTQYRPEDRLQSAAAALDGLAAVARALPADPAGTPALGTASTSGAAADLATLPSDPTRPPSPQSTQPIPRPPLWIWMWLGMGGTALVGTGIAVAALAVLIWASGWLDPAVPNGSVRVDPTMDPTGTVMEPVVDPAGTVMEPVVGPADTVMEPVVDPVVAPPRPEVEAPPPPEPEVRPPEPEVRPRLDPVPEAPPDMGRLSVSSRPWSQVEIDGSIVGNTPWKAEVPQGSHRVRLVRDGEAAVVRTLMVGDETSFCWDYAEEAPCLRLP